MNNTMKTAFSLPTETYKRGETLRRKVGVSRSALYATALEFYLKALEVREMEARYAEGYRKKPESAADMDAATQASLSALPDEGW